MPGDERAREAVRTDPEAAAALIEETGQIDVITGRTVHKACRQGAPMASRIVDATVEYLGVGLTSGVNAFNPECGVLGGGVLKGHPPYVERAREIVKRRALKATSDELEILASDLDDHAGAIGASRRRSPSTSAPRPAQAFWRSFSNSRWAIFGSALPL